MPLHNNFKSKALITFWILWCFLILIYYYTQLWGTFENVLTTSMVPLEIKLMVKDFIAVSIIFVCIVALLAGVFYLFRSTSLFRRCFFLAVFLLLLLLVLFFFHPPYFAEAAKRVLLGLFGVSSIVIAAVFSGWELFQLLKWQFDRWEEKLLFQLVTGLVLFSVCSLVFASLGIYNPISIRLFIGVILMAGFVRLYKKNFFNRFINKGKHYGSTTKFNLDLKKKILASITGLAFVFSFLAALAPETEFDALTYHLYFPDIWLQHGYLVDLPDRYVSLYPMSWGLLFGMGMSIGGVVAAKLLHFICLPLTCILISIFVKRLLPGASALLAVAIFATIPIVLWEASTAYVDLALAMHVGLGVYSLFVFINNKQRKWLLLAGINIGMALATKHLALFVFALTTIGLISSLWIKRCSVGFISKSVVLFLTAAILLPLPWYIRSFIASGNPVFPELFNIFGAPLNRWDAKTGEGLKQFFNKFGRPRTLTNIVTLPWDMTMHASKYGGTIGPIFLIVVPTVLFKLYKRMEYVFISLIVFILCYILLWASPFSSFQMRFIVPITPFLSIIAAAGFCYIWKDIEIAATRSKAILYFVCFVLVLNLPPFITFHEVDRKGWDGWLTHVLRKSPTGVLTGKESEEAYLTRMIPSYKAWQFINLHTPINSFILTFTDGDHYYSKRKRIWSNATIAQPIVWTTVAGKSQQTLDSLNQLRVTHILFDKHTIEILAREKLPIATAYAFENWYEIIYEDSKFLVCQLK